MGRKRKLNKRDKTIAQTAPANNPARNAGEDDRRTLKKARKSTQTTSIKEEECDEQYLEILPRLAASTPPVVAAAVVKEETEAPPPPLDPLRDLATTALIHSTPANPAYARSLEVIDRARISEYTLADLQSHLRLRGAGEDKIAEVMDDLCRIESARNLARLATTRLTLLGVVLGVVEEAEAQHGRLFRHDVHAEIEGAFRVHEEEGEEEEEVVESAGTGGSGLGRRGGGGGAMSSSSSSSGSDDEGRDTSSDEDEDGSDTTSSESDDGEYIG